ncbi:unnamed protein product [Enterobius vermicularis]|uniref:EF-hand domain-containing protein n=1 Tax=Enterobius vermicularis TaxID=51028 RepID=A0A0N4UVI3_ENTVE|nr:unnamed protein product [Enterobius vermicularis]
MEHCVSETEKLFELCDREKKGYLVVDDLIQSCPQLSHAEIDFVFKTLDVDGSGKIERKEFVEGFNDALGRKNKNDSLCVSSPSNETGYSSDEANTSCNPDNFLSTDNISEPESSSFGRSSSALIQGEEVYHSESDASIPIDLSIPCQEEVLKLYEQLQSCGMGKMLSRFERIVGNFCKELKDRKDENLRLQHVYESERRLYSRRMQEVESEMDQHILESEQRIREEEKKRLTWEKEEMRLKLEAEMDELKENIAKMKLIEASLDTGGCKSDQTAELKAKLKANDILTQQRLLLTVEWNCFDEEEELGEKYELSDENESLKTNLADSHIELALIKSELLNVKSEYESTKEELLSDTEFSDANKKLHDTNDSLRGALSQRNVLYKQIRRLSAPRIVPPPMLLQQHSPEVAEILPSEERQISHQIMHSSAEEVHKDAEYAVSLNSPHPRDSNIRSESEDIAFQNASGTPERTFRIVMCGDAAVGKSSLVYRIIKGSFSGSLPSTLGVDFYVKTVRIEGKVVAVQLWDTAGQERFRSLCKSYFRRADGAILVYDCVSERTFIRVREWIDIIRESTLRPIPVMLCGNKTDLRRGLGNSGGCVTTKDGEEVAEALGVIFAECSALDGSNVDNAFFILARELMATEDVEVKSTGVTLTEKKSSSCCGRR